MKFEELEKLADATRDKISGYVSVSLTYQRFESGRVEREYRFYQSNGGGHRSAVYDTSGKLKRHMEEILNPPKDEGVEV